MANKKDKYQKPEINYVNGCSKNLSTRVLTNRLQNFVSSGNIPHNEKLKYLTWAGKK